MLTFRGCLFFVHSKIDIISLDNKKIRIYIRKIDNHIQYIRKYTEKKEKGKRVCMKQFWGDKYISTHKKKKKTVQYRITVKKMLYLLTVKVMGLCKQNQTCDVDAE